VSLYVQIFKMKATMKPFGSFIVSLKLIKKIIRFPCEAAILAQFVIAIGSARAECRTVQFDCPNVPSAQAGTACPSEAKLIELCKRKKSECEQAKCDNATESVFKNCSSMAIKCTTVQVTPPFGAAVDRAIYSYTSGFSRCCDC
jgi:hypothetical protein